MTSLIRIAALWLTLSVGATLQASPSDAPAYWKFAATPPMGWNSYDAWGTSVTETQVLENARWMREHLRAHGWKYIVIDARWYDTVSSYDDRNLNGDRTGASLFADAFGRLLPATNRFPSAIDGRSFKPLAHQIHAMGLKFGIHIMRGIPRESVSLNTPIQGSRFTAADAADRKNICGWCPDMFGVSRTPAGQAWYDSCARLWASWGLDFVKVDDLSSPYHASEIDMIRQAIDKCGRPIVLSASAGPINISWADHVSHHANMWRISTDFWDRWRDLDHAFDLLAGWQDVGGPGHWTDLDMIPLGHIGIKCTIAGPDRQTRFSQNEQVTLMSLWALAPSPLMLGGNLPDTDQWTLSLLANDEVLAINQDPLGKPARRVNQANGTEIWVKPLKNGYKAIGLFNRSAVAQNVGFDWADAELGGEQKLRDLWAHKDLGTFDLKYDAMVPSYGAVLLLVTSQKSRGQLSAR